MQPQRLHTWCCVMRTHYRQTRLVSCEYSSAVEELSGLNTLPSTVPDEAVADAIAQEATDAIGQAEMTGVADSPQMEVSFSQQTQLLPHWCADRKTASRAVLLPSFVH